jgi:hypothetical protein
MKRRSALSLRKPEAIRFNRALALKREEFQHFYSSIENISSKFKLQPTRIYNVNKTEISTVQSPSRATILKGIKQIGALTWRERLQNVTVCSSSAAAG